MIYRLHDWHDLRPFGIDVLTGEACRVGTRILCDLTPEGRRIVADLLGVPDHPDGFGVSWNGGKADSSILLPRDLWHDLAVWCLLSRCVEVCDTRHERDAKESLAYWDLNDLRELARLDPADVDCDHWLPLLAARETRFFYYGGTTVDGIDRIFSNDDWAYWRRHVEYLKHSQSLGRFYRVRTEQPGVGTRCRHAFSGRVA
jgi:hypothetical protein